MSEQKKSEHKKFLTPKQRLFVTFWNGNQTEAARLAGYANPEVNGNILMQKYSHVREAVKEKDHAFLQRLGEREAGAVTMTRSKIINKLAEIADKSESDGVKVSALSILAKIYGMIINKTEDVTKKFAGWTDQEMEEFATTGVYPERIRSLLGSGGMSGSPTDSPAV